MFHRQKKNLKKKKKKVQRVPTGGEAKMGRYGAENGPAKAAVHVSQLLDGKLPWGSEALRRCGYGVLAEIAKFLLCVRIYSGAATPR